MACAVEGKRVLVIKLDDVVYAYDDRCAHLGVRLSEGSLEGAVLTCRAHQYQYDARTGRGVNPATVCLRAFPVKLEQGQIWVDVGAEASAR